VRPSKEITFFASKTQITTKQGLAKENTFNTILCKCKKLLSLYQPVAEISATGRYYVETRTFTYVDSVRYPPTYHWKAEIVPVTTTVLVYNGPTLSNRDK
jgi:hypothetical protein